MINVKDKIIKEIEKQLSDYEVFVQYLTNAKSIESRAKKIQYISVSTKAQDCLLTAFHYNQLLNVLFNESFEFSEQIKKSLEEYRVALDSVVIVKGQVSYSTEFDNVFAQLESKILNN